MNFDAIKTTAKSHETDIEISGHGGSDQEGGIVSGTKIIKKLKFNSRRCDNFGYRNAGTTLLDSFLIFSFQRSVFHL